MTEVQRLARFVTGTDSSQLSPAAVEQLKFRVLDTLGVAIAALDAEPMIAIRGLTERLGGEIQQLLRLVQVRPDAAYSARVPGEMPSRVEVELVKGIVLTMEASSYRGSHADRFGWDDAVSKFDKLAAPFTEDALRARIVAVVQDLDRHTVAELTFLLAQVSRCRRQPGEDSRRPAAFGAQYEAGDNSARAV